MTLPDAAVVDESVAVRFARSDECPRLAEWNAQLIRDERHDAVMSPAALEARLREWLSADYRAAIFEHDGAPAGYALFREQPEWTHLRQFFVAVAHRRRGVGRPAVAALRRDFFPPGKRVLVEVLAWNTGGLAFWKNAGFGERYRGLELPATPHPAS